MKAEKDFGAPKPFEPSKTGPLPALSGEMVAVWDPALQKLHQDEFDANAQQSQLAQEEYETKSQEEYDKNMLKIEEETDNTRQQQKEAQDKGRNEVESHRESWQNENEQVQQKFEKDSTSERDKVGRDIDAKVSEANKNVEAKCKEAEAKAGEEQKKADDEADRKKREAEEKSKNRSWWQKIGDAVGDFFNALKEAVCKIFDALRSLVKGIIELAKKAVSFIIDAARNLIVGFIKAFAEVLKGFVRIALAAFPELRDKFIGYIDKAVEKTIAVIDTLAKVLKDVVFMYLDFVASVYNALLDVAQGIVMVSIMLNEMLITGNTELLDGIANLYNSASAMTGEMFWDAVMGEMTGMNPGEALPGTEWEDEGQRDKAMQKRMEELFGGMEGTHGDLPNPSQENPSQGTPQGIEMDSMPDEELEPEMMAQIAEMPEDGMLETEGANDPLTMQELTTAAGGQPAENSLGISTGGGPSTANDTDGTYPVDAQGGMNFFTMSDQEKLDFYLEQMKPDCETTSEPKDQNDGGEMQPEAKVGPLSSGVRRPYIMSQLKKGISNWWDCNWWKVVLALVGVLVVGVILTVITAGGFLAVLPVIMEVLGAIFLTVMMVKMEEHVKAYLQQAWKGGAGIQAGAKSLAKAVAVGAIELIFNVIFKFGAIFKAIKGVVLKVISAIKYAIKATLKATVKVVKWVAKGVLKLAKVAGKVVMKSGKYVFQGLKKGFSKGAKTLKDLGNRILKFVGFKRIVIQRSGQRFRLLGEINPLVPLTPWISISRTPKQIGKGKNDLWNAIKTYGGKTWKIGQNEFRVDKGSIKHFFERHHPKFWNGTIKENQSFLPTNWGISDVEKAISSIIKQNRKRLLDRPGNMGMFQITGKYGAQDIVVGFKNGKIGQLYIK